MDDPQRERKDPWERILLLALGKLELGCWEWNVDAHRLILTDLSMPHMDGVTLARSLKRLNPSVRIVVSTGQLRKGVRAELEGLGVRHILRKPYTGDELLHCLRDAIDSN